MRRALVLSVALGGLACSRPVVPRFPVDADVSAILYAIEPPAGDVQIFAVSDAAPEQLVEPDADARITALLYRDSLGALQLPPGRVELVEKGRPLPRFAKAFSTEDWSHDLWSEVSTLDDRLDAIRISPLDFITCIESRGCSDESSGICAVPCPDVGALWSSDELEPPEQPRAPSVTLCGREGEPECFPARLGACAMGSAQFYGDANCTLTSSCATPIAIGTPLYVRPGGTGDCLSPTTPCGSIAAAIAAAPPAPMPVSILLDRGTFSLSGTVHLREGMSLLGVCAAETIIQAPREQSYRVVADGAVTARNLTLEGAGFTALARSQLVLEGVEVRSSDGDGVLVESSAAASLQRVVVRDCADAAVETQGDLELRETVLEDDIGYGLYAVNGGTAAATDLVVHAVRSGGVDHGGTGLFANVSGTITATRALIQSVDSVATSSRAFGALAALGSRIELQDVDLVQTASSGHGLGLFDVATGIVRRARIQGRYLRGVDLQGATLDVQDLVVRGREGIFADPGSHLIADRVHVDTERYCLLDYGPAEVENFYSNGCDVQLQDPSAIVTLRNLNIQGRTSSLTPAISIEGGARAELDNVTVEDHPFIAVQIAGACSFADIHDLQVSDPNVPAHDSTGLWVGGGAAVLADRVSISNQRLAVYFSGLGFCGAQTVTSTLTRLGIDRSATYGVIAADGVSLWGERVHVADTTDDGVYVYSHARARLAEATIQRAGAAGVLIEESGSIELRRFRLEDNVTGIRVLKWSEAEVRGPARLHEGRISGSSSGVDLHPLPDGFDLADLFDRVDYSGNTQTIEVEE